MAEAIGPRPGLAKVRTPRLLGRKRVELVRIHEGPWRDAIERADVVSEGRSDVDGDALVYFGSTSLLLKTIDDGGDVPRCDVATIAAALHADPHVRVRALRVAHREAMNRAGGRMGPLTADISFASTSRGVLITIEVSAKVGSRSLPKLAREE